MVQTSQTKGTESGEGRLGCHHYWRAPVRCSYDEHSTGVVANEWGAIYVGVAMLASQQEHTSILWQCSSPNRQLSYALGASFVRNARSLGWRNFRGKPIV